MKFADPQRLVTAAVITIAGLTMFAAESARPLRPRIEDRVRRTFRNLTSGAISLLAVFLLQMPVLIPVARWAESNRIGLLYLVSLPTPVELALAVILLDLTLWYWHVANHLVPFLWRFHLVHHIDLDLDASTALRFHFGEMVLSVFYRSLQVVVIGADARAVWIWQAILFAAILFHHSNLRLPIVFERWLVRFVVTPRMHGIHHSQVREETNSNWSSILTCWDFLHRTLRLDVRQSEVRIGVPAYRDPAELTIGRILVLPFRRQRNDWLGAEQRPATPNRLTLAE